MKKTFHTLTAALIFFTLFLLTAQLCSGQPVEMASELRSSGKIYVVVAVLAIIFAGIVIYLIRIDRKLSKLEKEIGNKD